MNTVKNTTASADRGAVSGELVAAGPAEVGGGWGWDDVSGVWLIGVLQQETVARVAPFGGR
jgi:hypothetical protein